MWAPQQNAFPLSMEQQQQLYPDLQTPPQTNPNFVQHCNPALPYTLDITGNGGIFPGKTILIKGVVTQPNKNDPSGSPSQRIVVDLCCGKLIQGDHQDNKALHLNPRFDLPKGFFGRLGLSSPDNDVVLNSLTDNHWGPEQRCPRVLEVGKAFTIRIQVLPDFFKVTLNGSHRCDYVHRVPWEQIRMLYIDGCCRLEVVEFSSEGAAAQDSNQASHGGWAMPSAPPMYAKIAQPNSGLPVPFVIDLPRTPLRQLLPRGGFWPPRLIRLLLTPTSATSFTMSMLQGGEHLMKIQINFPKEIISQQEVPSANQHHSSTATVPTPNAGAHPTATRTETRTTVTYVDGSVLKNSTCNGAWLREEQEMWNRRDFPFHARTTADVRIVAGSDHAKVWVNGQQLTYFVYRTWGSCGRGSANASYPQPELVDHFSIDGSVTLQKFEISDQAE